MKKIREGYKMTELGEIPEKWQIRKLRDIGEIVTGSTPKTAEKDNYGLEYLWVSPADMGEKKYIIKTSKMLSKKGFEKTRKLPKGSILVTCIGSTIGKIGIAGYELSTNQQVNSIICKLDYDNEFIYYDIDFNFNNYISYISTQAIPIINKTTFSEFRIPMPPLKEQQKISSILTCVDEQIEITDNLIENTKELKKGLMQRLLTKGIGHSRFKDTEIGRIPEEWEIRKLGEICTLKGRIGWRGYTKEDLRDCGPLVIGATQISSNNKIDLYNPTYISKEKYEESPEIKVNLGDIILVKTGNTIGKVAIVKDYIGEATINPNTVLIKEIRCNNNFLYHIIASHLVQNVLNSLITIGAQPSINQDKLKKIIIPIPTLEEQEKISLILSSVDKQIEQCELKKENLQELKKGLMQKLLTGKIRVRV